MIAYTRSRTTSVFALVSALVLSIAGCRSSTPSAAPSGVAPAAASETRYAPARDLGPDVVRLNGEGGRAQPDRGADWTTSARVASGRTIE